MEPNIRGELTITIGDKVYTLRPSIKALLRIEDALDLSLPEIAQVLTKQVETKEGKRNKTPKSVFLLKIIWAAIQESEPELSWEEFEKRLWGNVELTQLFKAASAMIYSCMLCGRQAPKGEAVREPEKAPSAEEAETAT